MSNTTIKNLILSQPKVGQGPENPIPTLDHVVISTDDKVVVNVEIPGVDPDLVEVLCENNVLSVNCPRGEFSMAIDPTTNVSKIEADIKWGLLTICIPSPSAPPVRTIKVSIHDTVKKTTSKVEEKVTA